MGEEEMGLERLGVLWYSRSLDRPTLPCMNHLEFFKTLHLRLVVRKQAYLDGNLVIFV